jgi:hypothetical protein
MRLLTAHKIFIGAALLLALLFAARAAYGHGSSHANSDVIYAVVSLVVAAFLGLYLRFLWHR